MTSPIPEGEFTLFIDESGSPKPNPNDSTPFFAMGGILVKRRDEAEIEETISQFKNRWSIANDVALHGSEIRSQKKHFAWLGDLSKDEQEAFFEDLTETIISCPILVHACVISRQGYLNRYLNVYGEKTWEMMKSAFSILVERAAKYAITQEGTIMIYFEKVGKKEDRLIKSYFNDLRSQGLPFAPKTSNQYSPMPATELSSALRGIEGKSKNNSMIQLADLCLYPIAKSKLDPSYKAFVSLKKANLIIDCCLEESQQKQLGIKYYCYDESD